MRLTNRVVCIWVGLACLLLLLGLPLRTAAAQSTNTVSMYLSGKPLRLEAPVGFCALDKSKETDRLVFEVMSRAIGQQNRLIAYFLNCEDYRMMQAGQVFEVGRYAIVMIPGQGKSGSPKVDGLTRQRLLHELSALYQSEKFMGKANAVVKKHFEDLDPGHVMLDDIFTEEERVYTAAEKEALAKAREEILAGDYNVFPLGEDDVAVYLGFAMPDGYGIRAGAGGTTAINEVPIMISFYDAPARADLFPALRDEASAMLRRAIKASEQ